MPAPARDRGHRLAAYAPCWADLWRGSAEMPLAQLAVALVLQSEPPLRGPEAVMAAVAAHGAKPVVREVWSDAAACRALLSGVGAGKPEWLRAALALRPGTDAGASEDLDEAFARGLLASPARVLPILRDLWWEGNASRVCEFDWDSELPGGVSRYVTQFETALRRDRAVPPSLRDACKAGIERTRVRIRRHESEERGRPTRR
jgi:hypothetical protein